MKKLPLLFVFSTLFFACINNTNKENTPLLSNTYSDIVYLLSTTPHFGYNDSTFEEIEILLFDSILKNKSLLSSNPIDKYNFIDSAIYSFNFEDYSHIIINDRENLFIQENQLRFLYYYLTKQIKNILSDTTLHNLLNQEKNNIDSLLSSQYSFIENHKGNYGTYSFVQYYNASIDLFSVLNEMQKDFYFTLIDSSYDSKTFQQIPSNHFIEAYKEIEKEIPNPNRIDDNLYNENDDYKAFINMQTNWNNLYNIRSLITNKLSGKIKQTYINGTYQLQRYQLIQLKHKFYGLVHAGTYMLTDSSSYEEIYTYKTDDLL